MTRGVGKGRRNHQQDNETAFSATQDGLTTAIRTYKIFGFCSNIREHFANIRSISPVVKT